MNSCVGVSDPGRETYFEHVGAKILYKNYINAEGPLKTQAKDLYNECPK